MVASPSAALRESVDVVFEVKMSIPPVWSIVSRFRVVVGANFACLASPNMATLHDREGRGVGQDGPRPIWTTRPGKT